ncbi:MAG: hypothetical protein JWQ78_2216 [Sediminibacterium sp.]|jgi:hypothetical protein|nr:hypothetical protein [Sediminibacterium sp.]
MTIKKWKKQRGVIDDTLLLPAGKNSQDESGGKSQALRI